mgnify:CR=1 FL=1
MMILTLHIPVGYIGKGVVVLDPRVRVQDIVIDVVDRHRKKRATVETELAFKEYSAGRRDDDDNYDD